MKKKSMFLRVDAAWVIMLCSIFLLSGCAGNTVRTQKMVPVVEEHCRVAVLPFLNETDFEVGDVFFYRVFSAELLSFGKFEIAQEGDVRKVYRQMRIAAQDVTTVEQLRVLAERLESEVLITCRITLMDDKTGGTRSLPVLAVAMRMVDGRTGEEMVSTFHRREGEEYRHLMQFGLVHSMSGLSRLVAREILEKWKEKGLLRCTE